MKGLIRLFGFIAVLTVTIFVTSYISRLPDSNCTTAPISESWSVDRAYKATILQKNCNSGETFFYSVKVEKVGVWFFIEDLETDPYPRVSKVPTMAWVGSRKLEIAITAEDLSGFVERKGLGDFTLVRT